MDTVKLSNMKPQSTDIIPESIQLDNLIETGDPDRATS